jgi:hypothetical protein
MRGWIPLCALLLVGCFDIHIDLANDPCRDHAGSGGLFDRGNCSCPLKSEFSPLLDGKECTQPGTTCESDSFLSSASSCRCDWWTKRWQCGTMDLSIPAPPADLAETPDSD